MPLLELIPMITGAPPSVPVPGVAISGASTEFYILLGVMIGGFIISILIAFILFFLGKAGVIRFSGSPHGPNGSKPNIIQGPHCIVESCPEHAAEKQRSIANKRAIRDIWKAINPLRHRLPVQITRLEIMIAFMLNRRGVDLGKLNLPPIPELEEEPELEEGEE